jgi:long-chain acyl-CoA synthetase
MGYAQLHDWSVALAAGLIERCNIGAGEKIALVVGNRPEWLPLSLAIQGAGAVEVPCRPEMDQGELIALLHDAEAVVVVVEHVSIGEVLLASARELPALRQVVVIEPERCNLPRVLAMAELESAGRQALARDAGPVLERQRRSGPDSIAAVIHTSGTTGKPKAVLLSHRNLLHSLRYMPGEIGLTEQDRVLLCLPLWHLYGRLIAYLALACGASVHFGALGGSADELRRVQPSCFPAFPAIWEQIHRRCLAQMRRCGWQAWWLRHSLGLSRRFLRARDIAAGFGRSGRGRRLVEAAAAGLLYLPHRLAQRVMRSAILRELGAIPRLGIVGDAPLPQRIDEDLRALGFTVLEGYGSTEQVVSCIRRPGRNVPGTIGEPLPWVELFVVDSALRRVADGEIGQLAVSGPQVCKGYQGSDFLNATNFAVIDGRRFLLTGDLGWRDRSGFLVFAGRIANVLTAADGAVVYPELTERLLCGSPLISDAVLYPRKQGGIGVLLFLEPAVTGVSSLRRELGRLLRPGVLKAGQVPTHFMIAGRPLRLGRELTPTLKLRRAATYASLCGGPEYRL